MKLKSRKCPNCGADLHINDEDKTVKCKYCSSVFEIDRTNDEVLKVIKGINKNRNIIFSSFYVVFIFAFIFIALISILMFSNVFSFKKKTNIIETGEKVDIDIKNEDIELTDENIKNMYDESLNIFERYLGNTSLTRIKIYILKNSVGVKIYDVYKINDRFYGVFYTGFTVGDTNYSSGFISNPINFKNGYESLEEFENKEIKNDAFGYQVEKVIDF